MSSHLKKICYLCEMYFRQHSFSIQTVSWNCALCYAALLLKLTAFCCSLPMEVFIASTVGEFPLVRSYTPVLESPESEASFFLL